VPGAAPPCRSCPHRVECPGNRLSHSTEGVTAMTEYLIAAVIFVAMVTTLVYLWKREHS
jgi:hypothetical protein